MKPTGWRGHDLGTAGSAKKAGQWEAKIEYRELEKDAVWDELSDFNMVRSAPHLR